MYSPGWTTLRRPRDRPSRTVHRTTQAVCLRVKTPPATAWMGEKRTKRLSSSARGDERRSADAGEHKQATTVSVAALAETPKFAPSTSTLDASALPLLQRRTRLLALSSEHRCRRVWPPKLTCDPQDARTIATSMCTTSTSFHVPTLPHIRYVSHLFGRICTGPNYPSSTASEMHRCGLGKLASTSATPRPLRRCHSLRCWSVESWGQVCYDRHLFRP